MSADNSESVGLYELWAWFEIHKKQVLIICCLIAIVALGTWYYIWHTKQREIQASAALLKLGLNIHGSYDKQIKADDFIKIAETFDGTATAEKAFILAAGQLFSEDKYKEALDFFRKFQSKYPSSRILDLAILGEASSLEGMGQLDDALKVYRDLAQKNTVTSYKAKLAIGRILQLKGQYSEALKAYDELVRSAPNTIWSEEALKCKDYLTLKHPELAPINTNRPSATAPLTNLLGAPQTNKSVQGSLTNAINNKNLNSKGQTNK